MRRSMTIAAVCEITAEHAVRTGDFTRFDAWVASLTRELDEAEHAYRVARDSVSNAHHAARLRRALMKARKDLKALEAAQTAAWTARNRLLLTSADAAVKTA